MASLSDPDFCDALDDLLQAATVPSKRLMEIVFISNSISPHSGQLVTMSFAAGLFIFHYNEYRDEGYDVETAIQASQAQVAAHPVIQEGLARLMTQRVNKGVVESAE